jgi:hypothetical protein
LLTSAIAIAVLKKKMPSRQSSSLVELEAQERQSNTSSSSKLDGSRGPEENVNQAEATTNLAEWSGPNDPQNPLNWSLLSRSLHLFVPASLILAV